jgi:hypothetical protein
MSMKVSEGDPTYKSGGVKVSRTLGLHLHYRQVYVEAALGY